MVEIDAELADNYRQLKAERGLTWEQLAQQVQAQGDRRLSAWMREQAAAEGGADRMKPPRQRRPGLPMDAA